jgi:hypothetical protein
MTPDSQPPPNVQAPAKNNTTVWVAVIAIGVVFGACGLCAFLGVLGNLANQNRSGASRSERANTQTTGNPAHDILLTLSPSDQATSLGKSVGEGCVGDYAFFMGMAKDKNVFWSVRCTNGKSYEVMISPDAYGSTKVLECDVLQLFTKIRCFEKLQE